MNEITIVTATCINALGECATSCASVSDGETLEEVTELQKANALDLFAEDFDGALHVLIYVSRVDVPEVNHTLIESAPIIETIKPEIN